MAQYIQPVAEEYLTNTCFKNNQTIISVDCSNVPFVGNSAAVIFLECKNLQTVTNINNNVTNADHTFYNCYNLVNAPIVPNSVTSMVFTFYSCYNLVNAPVIPDSVTNMYSTFALCSKLTNISSLSNSVTNLYQTFAGCKKLVNAPTIPNSVTNMYGTFFNCRSLVDAPEIPNSVLSLSETFSNCTNLVNAPIIPNSVTNMSSTFHYCTKLTGNINIQSSQVTNATNCFNGTSIDKNVYIPFIYENGEYTKTYNSFISAGYSTTTRVKGVLLMEYIPETIDYEYTTSGTNATLTKYIASRTNITIPTTINGYNVVNVSANTTFRNNSKIVNIDCNQIPFNSATYAYNASHAFQNCVNLQTVTNIHNSITNMAYAFADSPKIENVPVLPSATKSLGYVFSGCSNLINTPAIPNSVTNMAYAFAGCSQIVVVSTIPNSVSEMRGCFMGCTNLTGNIYIESTSISRATNCFDGTTLEKNVYIPFKYENGVNTLTYNSFTSAGYSTTTRKDGVLLFDTGTH